MKEILYFRCYQLFPHCAVTMGCGPSNIDKFGVFNKVQSLLFCNFINKNKSVKKLHYLEWVFVTVSNMNGNGANYNYDSFDVSFHCCRLNYALNKVFISDD